MPRINRLLILILLLAGTATAQEETVIDRVIAVVDEEIILESEVLQIVQDVVLNNRAKYTTPDEIAKLREQVLKELINQKIMLAVALKDTNIVVEDREVDQTLNDRIELLTNEIGSMEKLEEYFNKPIRQIRREYRSQVRDGLLIDRFRSRKLMGISANRHEVEDFFKRNKDQMPELPERIHIAHILIPIEPTELAKNKAKAKADSLFQLLMQGKELAQLAIKYSDDRASGAKGGLLGTTERGDLFPAYEEVAYSLEEGEISAPFLSPLGYHIIQLNWRRGEKINTSHILISLKPDKSDEQRALSKIASLRERILQGEDFAEIAREYSQDEETAKLGGDLGWFDLTSMPEDFRFVVKDMEVNEVSEPFKTQFGIHLLKLNERAMGRQMDLYKDWERISRLATNEKQDKIYHEWVDKISEDVYVEVFSD